MVTSSALVAICCVCLFCQKLEILIAPTTAIVFVYLFTTSSLTLTLTFFCSLLPFQLFLLPSDLLVSTTPHNSSGRFNKKAGTISPSLLFPSLQTRGWPTSLPTSLPSLVYFCRFLLKVHSPPTVSSLLHIVLSLSPFFFFLLYIHPLFFISSPFIHCTSPLLLSSPFSISSNVLLLLQKYSSSLSSFLSFFHFIRFRRLRQQFHNHSE